MCNILSKLETTNHSPIHKDIPAISSRLFDLLSSDVSTDGTRYKL